MDYSKFEGHTPGPWKIENRQDHGEISIAARGRRNGGYIIARTFGPDMQANSALIASAPDLLEENKRLRKALELCRDVLSNTPSAYHENSKLHSIFDMLCDLNEQK